MTAAALGTTLPLETLDGEEQLDIAPGTQPGEVVTLRARGVPTCAAPAAATCTSTSTCRCRPGSTPRQEKLLRELAALRGEEHPAACRQAAAACSAGVRRSR